MELNIKQLIENEKQQALAYISKLPEFYTEDNYDEFDVVVQEYDETNDIPQITVEVSPYWADVDEIEGGLDSVEYEGQELDINDVPKLTSDLVVRVITRDFGSMIKDNEVFIPINNYTEFKGLLD